MVETMVNGSSDKLAQEILAIINQAGEPLETKEILARLKKGGTRTMIFYRLQNLRAEGKVKGKFVGPGKGVWIWWIQYGKK